MSIVRDFGATPAQVFRAHTDPELFVKWCGPDTITNTIREWNATTGGHWSYIATDDNGEYRFFGSFHEIRENERIVQTFTFEGSRMGSTSRSSHSPTSARDGPGCTRPRSSTLSSPGTAWSPPGWSTGSSTATTDSTPSSPPRADAIGPLSTTDFSGGAVVHVFTAHP